MSDSSIIDDAFFSPQFKIMNNANVQQWKDLIITAACLTVCESPIKSKLDLQNAAEENYVKYVELYGQVC